MTSNTPRRTNLDNQTCYFAVVATLCLIASSVARADGTLTLPEFLKQVEQGNTGTKGAHGAAEAQSARVNEAELLITPTAFATIQYARDGKPQLVPVVNYDFQNIAQYSIGVSQLTTFGLQAKLSTNMYSLSYTNPSSPFFSAIAPLLGAGGTSLGSIGGGSFNFTNQLELTQSLWGNGFGSSTRANQNLVQAEALAQSYGNRFAARASLVDAEGAYWRLAISRQSVELSRDNLARAQKTYDWNERRARLQLADRSDALQSQALLAARTLEYQRAQDDERTASRAFNSARGISSDSVTEKLTLLDSQTILAMTPPARAELRDDVAAAQQQTRIASATAEMSRERDKPTLNVFGTLGLNGQNTAFGTAYGQAFSLDHPTAAVGVQFSSPIAFVLAPHLRAAYSREEAAADLTYQRKVFEQDEGWRDLNDRLAQAKTRLQLAVSLEKAQHEKLFHEQERYKTGRTTAFQVLTFESDYAQSQLGRLVSESDVLSILAQMKLFSTPGESL